MLQSTLAKILLAPISLLYGLGISFRNYCYRRGLLKGISFSVPVISVGNLSVGGAGKTPHIELLIRNLRDHVHIATLSRGYRRKTKGFQLVKPTSNAEEVGDEPLQFARKFPDVLVAVAEERAFAIPQIVGARPATELILLDDAFQHRAVQPGLNILLTQYNLPFTRDYLLPSGRLREWRSAYARADVIIVTKCPPVLDAAAAQRLREEIDPLPHQTLYFTYYDYGAALLPARPPLPASDRGGHQWPAHQCHRQYRLFARLPGYPTDQRPLAGVCRPPLLHQAGNG